MVLELIREDERISLEDQDVVNMGDTYGPQDGVLSRGVRRSYESSRRSLDATRRWVKKLADDFSWYATPISGRDLELEVTKPAILPPPRPRYSLPCRPAPELPSIKAPAPAPVARPAPSPVPRPSSALANAPRQLPPAAKPVAPGRSSSSRAAKPLCAVTVLAAGTRVTNVVASPHTSPSSQAKAHYQNFASWPELCCALGCNARATEGGHVQLFRGGAPTWFIIPVCRRPHSQQGQSSTFAVKAAAQAVEDLPAFNARLTRWKQSCEKSWR